jgi:hypothetical protein
MNGMKLKPFFIETPTYTSSGKDSACEKENLWGNSSMDKPSIVVKKI